MNVVQRQERWSTDPSDELSEEHPPESARWRKLPAQRVKTRLSQTKNRHQRLFPSHFSAVCESSGLLTCFKISEIRSDDLLLLRSCSKNWKEEMISWILWSGFTPKITHLQKKSHPKNLKFHRIFSEALARSHWIFHLSFPLTLEQK